jgi:hypothetical protein
VQGTAGAGPTGPQRGCRALRGLSSHGVLCTSLGRLHSPPGVEVRHDLPMAVGAGVPSLGNYAAVRVFGRLGLQRTCRCV